ncbi:30S ribosomal protein S15 [Candidatus Woesearchaeota archaeon]|nr:30S ribosomal protein S15 [Candidatus Woesearchaeota archaeon]
MAKRHSRARGKSGSHKPLTPKPTTWVRYKQKEIELLISKLAKEGKTTSQIGLALRDNYGIPDVKLLTGKTITQLLKEKNLAPEIPEDITLLMKRVMLIKKHMEKNKHDMHAKRGLQLTESKIQRLTNYFKRKKKLPLEWKYKPEELSTLLTQ